MPKRDILSEICEKRRVALKEKGFTFGFAIPEKRKRPVVPFLAEPGVILEVKRASPSKGDIAPGLNAPETAKSYVKAGAGAISCLTEENYFNGSLADLMAVTKAAGKKAAVLRKDFLLEPEEIEVSYKCGADAVLLIARILDSEKLLNMAECAFSKGISVLLEVREDSDVEKAFSVLKKAVEMDCEDKIVLGINSRNLSDFTIDLLIPLKLKERIKKLALEKKLELSGLRIISESGITSPEAAEFVGRIGFHGVLIGEAAAKSPEKAKNLVSSFKQGAGEAGKCSFWKKLAFHLENKPAGKPLVKICGIKDMETAVKASEAGADILGFIFAEKSVRTNYSDEGVKIQHIRGQLQNLASEGRIKMPLMVGVIVSPFSEEGKACIELYNRGILDGIQYHGCTEYAEGNCGYGALPLSCEADIEKLVLLYSLGFPRVLIDAKNDDEKNAEKDERYGGTGKQLSEQVVLAARKKGPLWLSGGINPENAGELVKKYRPELIDVNSGIESVPGKKDFDKLEKLFSELNKINFADMVEE